MFDSTTAGAPPGALLLSRPLLSQVGHLFVPLLSYYVISSLVGITDMLLAAELGSQAQAAVGLGDQSIFLVIAIGTGLCTACSSFISRAIGAGDLEKAAAFAADSLILALLIGLGATVLGFTLVGALLDVFSCSDSLKAQALPYIQICSLANVPFIIFMCQAAILRALGKPDSGTLIAVVSTVVSIVLSLIAFYLAPAPFAHSLNALAIAWIFGAFAGMIYGAFLLHKTLPKTTFKLQGSCARLRQLLQAAIPCVIGELAFIAANFYRYALIAAMPEAEAVQAAWTIRLKIEETVAILPMMALAAAVAVVCGHNTGAGKPEVVAAMCVKTAFLATTTMLVLGISLAFYAEFVAGVFTCDPTTKQAVVTLLQPAPVIFSTCAIWLILCGGLDGAGQTRATGFINTLDATAGRLALSLAFIGSGVAGLALASSLSCLMTAALSGYFFIRYLQPFKTAYCSLVQAPLTLQDELLQDRHKTSMTCD